MSTHATTERYTGAWVSASFTTVLSIATAVSVIFGLYLALGREDTEPLESPLLLAVSHQLANGPWGLYGPFGGQNPWVLIHAPLYYRLAALFAWPLVRTGLDPVTAAMAAGRSLSLIGLVGTMAAAYGIARLDGAPRVAGVWSALLIATLPVIGVMPYTVRPDMLGVALQTIGVLFVLSALYARTPRRGAVPAAYAAFGFAACIKQQFIVGALLSAILLLAACARGRLSPRAVVPGLLTGLAIMLAVYGAEELASAGRMSQAIFQAAASTRQVHPVDWTRMMIVVVGIIGRSGGLIVVVLAVVLAQVGARPGIGRRALFVVGIGLITAIAAQIALEHFMIKLTRFDELIIVSVFVLTVFLAIPTCLVMSLRSLLFNRLDGTLCLYLTAEIVLVLILSRASAGAWVNYGIQAVVFASIMTGRMLARTCPGTPGSRTSWLIVPAVFTLLFGVCANAKSTADRRNAERLRAAQVVEYYGRPASEFFFVNRPGLNRLHGRLNLVYDDWLYPVFESVHLAQSRSIWLRRALTHGGIRFVVNTSDSVNIDGIGQTLPELGYSRDIQLGTSFYVWRRIRFESAPRP